MKIETLAQFAALAKITGPGVLPATAAIMVRPESGGTRLDAVGFDESLSVVVDAPLLGEGLHDGAPAGLPLLQKALSGMAGEVAEVTLSADGYLEGPRANGGKNLLRVRVAPPQSAVLGAAPSPSSTGVVAIELPLESLAYYVSQAQEAAARENVRPNLTFIYLDNDKTTGFLAFTATDGHRMNRAVIHNLVLEGVKDVFMGPTVANLLTSKSLANLAGPGAQVQLVVSGSTYFYRIQPTSSAVRSITITQRDPDMQFPNVANVTPGDAVGGVFRFDRKTLVKNIKFLAKFAPDRTKGVTLDPVIGILEARNLDSPASVTMEVETLRPVNAEDLEEARVVVKRRLDSRNKSAGQDDQDKPKGLVRSPSEVTYNHTYLLAALTGAGVTDWESTYPTDADVIDIQIKDSIAPTVIRSYKTCPVTGKRIDLIHLVMALIA